MFTVPTVSESIANLAPGESALIRPGMGMLRYRANLGYCLMSYRTGKFVDFSDLTTAQRAAALIESL